MRNFVNTESLKLLCDPKTHSDLELKDNCLASSDGTVYQFKKGIPVFIKPEEVTGLNKKYQKFYDWVSIVYKPINFIYEKFVYGDLKAKRLELLGSLNIKPGDKVLETSIGTGINITLFDKAAKYWGIDISIGMLKACKKENKKWGYDLDLFQANAEELPFKENSFDVVFHVGGINFFNNIQKAIDEMIRVAKPGAQILICDETEKHVDNNYRKMPFGKKMALD